MALAFGEGMRRLLFALWLVLSAVGLFAAARLIHPSVSHFGSPASLAVAVVWLVGVVPLSFAWWFHTQRRHERALVELALSSWREQRPGAGTLMAQALECSLAEEDEHALCRLLDALSWAPPQELDLALVPFMQAASEWLCDDGGHSSRREHLAHLKESAAPLLPVLAQRR